MAAIYHRDSQVETIALKSLGRLSNGYYTDLLQGHMTEKETIQDVRCVYHYMDFYVSSFSQLFFYNLSPLFHFTQYFLFLLTIYPCSHFYPEDWLSMSHCLWYNYTVYLVTVVALVSQSSVFTKMK